MTDTTYCLSFYYTLLGIVLATYFCTDSALQNAAAAALFDNYLMAVEYTSPSIHAQLTTQ